jgi:hypothetical protein
MAAYLPTLYIFEFTEGAAVVMSGAEGGAINLLKHVHGNLPNLRLMHSIPLVVQNSPFKARILSCRGLRSIVGLNETIQPQVEDFKRRPMNPPITSSVMQQNDQDDDTDEDEVDEDDGTERTGNDADDLDEANDPIGIRQPTPEEEVANWSIRTTNP